MLDIVHAASQGSEISWSAPVRRRAPRRSCSGLPRMGPTVDGGPLALLKATYELAYKCCTDTIGRAAVLVEALRGDKTLAARFWIDKATGLLLQRQLFSADGKTMVRATVFTDLEIEDSEFLGHLPPMAPGGVEAIGMGKVDSLRSAGLDARRSCLPPAAVRRTSGHHVGVAAVLVLRRVVQRLAVRAARGAGSGCCGRLHSDHGRRGRVYSATGCRRTPCGRPAGSCTRWSETCRRTTRQGGRGLPAPAAPAVTRGPADGYRTGQNRDVAHADGCALLEAGIIEAGSALVPGGPPTETTTT